MVFFFTLEQQKLTQVAHACVLVHGGRNNRLLQFKLCAHTEERDANLAGKGAFTWMAGWMAV